VPEAEAREEEAETEEKPYTIAIVNAPDYAGCISPYAFGFYILRTPHPQLLVVAFDRAHAELLEHLAQFATCWYT